MKVAAVKDRMEEGYRRPKAHSVRSGIKRSKRRSRQLRNVRCVNTGDNLGLILYEAIEINGGAKKVVLDIGFGTGDSIVHMAEDVRTNGRDVFFFGCEIHRAGVAQCISEVARRDLRNVKLIRADATLLLGSHVPSGFLDEVHIYFPDPWPNAFRDGERRVVRSRIVGMLKDAPAWRTSAHRYRRRRLRQARAGHLRRGRHK